MNTKISKLLGIGLAIATLASMMIAGVPAAADNEIWNNEPGPSSLSTGSQTLVAGSDVTDFAVAKDGVTIYATSNGTNLGLAQPLGYTSNKGVWKSTNGGATWAPKFTTFTGSATIVTPYLIAVAPDDGNTVVVVDNTTKVVLSTDGGLTFNALTGHTMTTINDVAISPLAGGVRNIALAGTVGAVPDVQYLNMGAVVSNWKSMTTSTDPAWNASTITGTIDFQTIAFSPNFASDKVMLAVSNQAAVGPILEIASFSSFKWNTAAGFLNYPKSVTANFSATGPAVMASIALPPTYLGADETLRSAFVGIANAAGTGGAFYLRDSGTAETSLGIGANVASVAYDGTNLVVGAYASNSVYYSSNPTATTPTFSTTAQFQRPGGSGMVKVAFSGTNVVAGTSGLNSAFAVSKDLGATFNDVSLVDNRIVNIKDFAVSADGATVFTISDDNVTLTQLNTWRKSAGTWEKVLSYAVPTGLNTAGYITKIAPDDANSIYIANTNTFGGTPTDMLYSGDKGEKSWQLRSMIEAPRDIAIESAQVVYAVTGAGKVFKSVNSGFTWDNGVSTGITNGATIVSIKKDQLIIGGQGGQVAWSTDGSAAATTWVVKNAPTVFAGTPGTVVATADKLDAGGFIYVANTATGQDIRRWKVGTSTAWDKISTGTFPGGIYAIGMRDSSLAAIEFDAVSNNSSFMRILNPTTADASTIWSAQAWNSDVLATSPHPAVVPAITQYSMEFLNRVESKLQTSSDGKVWAINGRMSYAGVGGYSDQIYSITDTTYKTGPAPTLPADKASPVTNPVTGRVEDMVFSWPRLFATSQVQQLPLDYKLQVSLDSGFNQLILQPVVTPNPYSQDPVVAVVGPYQLGTFNYSFAPDTTYYWRVKMLDPLESAWSTTRSFSFSSLTPFVLRGPMMGDTGVSVNPILSWSSYTGAKWYELTLSEDPSFAIPEWSHNVYGLFYTVTADETLKFKTTYYWRVRGVTADPYVQGSTVITPAGPYATGAFTTVSEPVTTSGPAVIVSTVTSSAPPTIITLPPQVVEKEQPIPSWMLMTIIVIGLVLIIALIVLIVRTRRVA